jgi:hypothetical protein
MFLSPSGGLDTRAFASVWRVLLGKGASATLLFNRVATSDKQWVERSDNKFQDARLLHIEEATLSRPDALMRWAFAKDCLDNAEGTGVDSLKVYRAHSRFTAFRHGTVHVANSEPLAVFSRTGVDWQASVVPDLVPVARRPRHVEHSTLDSLFELGEKQGGKRRKPVSKPEASRQRVHEHYYY